MNRPGFLLVAAIGASLALSACTSARLQNFDPGTARLPAPLPAPDPIDPVPSGPVVAEPLPPITGEPLPPPPGSAALPPPSASPTDIAALPPRPAPAPAGRSALVGGWTAREASGGSCRVQLSSTPALDLYRASTSGCANRDLARVSAWEYRDGEVYLYQPGGTVTARLRGSSGSLDGVLAKSGAPLSLTR
jgi:hypothetical protein